MESNCIWYGSLVGVTTIICGHVNFTHWGWDKMDAILQTIFSNAFSLMKMLQLRLKFYWSLFPIKGPINNIPALVQIMAWCRPGDKPLSEPMMVNLLTHICVTGPQWWMWKLMQYVQVFFIIHVYLSNRVNGGSVLTGFDPGQNLTIRFSNKIASVNILPEYLCKLGYKTNMGK